VRLLVRECGGLDRVLCGGLLRCGVVLDGIKGGKGDALISNRISTPFLKVPLER
jgi:hypothetical protein